MSSAAEHPAGALRAGRLLDGRVYYQQPEGLYRTGIEPVILAATIPARAGDVVAEFGCGAGAGLLCLAARVSGVMGVGIEIQADLVAHARRNIDANGFADRLSVIEGDLVNFETPRQLDHVFANPPWHDEFSSRSAVPGRDLARRGRSGLLGEWVNAMARRLRNRGSLTMILPASSLRQGLSAMAESGCGATALFPLWTKPDQEARIIVLQGICGAKGPGRVLPGLVLHRPAGGFSAEAEAILRTGNPLQLGCRS
jgi:tRNA1(Val) A37 N6-methylase TrmN6